MNFIQPELFPVTDLQTDGYAQPEPRVEAEETEHVVIEDAA
ncbi:hypothetical protein ACFW2V_02985 [Streptomyces sp. NPDC058947]